MIISFFKNLYILKKHRDFDWKFYISAGDLTFCSYLISTSISIYLYTDRDRNHFNL